MDDGAYGCGCAVESFRVGTDALILENLFPKRHQGDLDMARFMPGRLIDPRLTNFMCGSVDKQGVNRRLYHARAIGTV